MNLTWDPSLVGNPKDRYSLALELNLNPNSVVLGSFGLEKPAKAQKTGCNFVLKVESLLLSRTVLRDLVVG